MNDFGATCEYHKLEKVMMYRPGEEVKQITVDSFRELSFRDVVWWKRFQLEHDLFCDTLRKEGVKVFYLNDHLSKGDQAVVDPNLVYMRDTCAVLPTGFIEMRMARQVRTPEPRLVKHALEKLGVPCLYSINSPGLLEGGDFVFPSDDTLFIGYSPRTNEEGALQAAHALLKETLKVVVLVPLPSWRVHIDGALMWLDKDLFLYHPASVTTFPARILRRNEETQVMPLMDFITEHFNPEPERIKLSDNDLYNFGGNVVCLDRRKAVIYECNERIITELRQRNVEILPIQGSELARGGGGPHCMTLPLFRK